MLLTAFVFFIILSLLVFIHELGHFAVARWVGVRVEEFGFGLPPRIFGKKIGGTIYSVNWLPIGGFVKLSGEDDEAERAEKGHKKKEYFWARSKKERSLILLAGVTMNFLLAVCITSFLLTQGIYEATGSVHIEQITSGSPAEAAGLREKDTLIDIRDAKETALPRKITIPKDLIDFTHANVGKQVALTILRDNQKSSVTLIPRKDYPAGEGPMGVVISDLELHKYPLSEAPFVAVRINIVRARDMLTGIGSVVGRLFRLQPVGNDIAGPIGIAQVTGQAVKFGLKAVLEFTSILSLNLAVLNLLPLPALDGGRFLFVFLEKILGGRIKPAFERSTHQIGMIILLALIVLISINDILRLARGG
jgi:regulator of sigma E protease